MIKAVEHIESGFSANDAQKVSALIDAELKSGRTVTIDFSGVKFFTTLFFNQAITKYMETIPVDEFDQHIKLINLSSVGETTYRHSYDYAKEYYSLSPDEREKRAQLIEDSMTDSE